MPRPVTSLFNHLLPYRSHLRHSCSSRRLSTTSNGTLLTKVRCHSDGATRPGLPHDGQSTRYQSTATGPVGTRTRALPEQDEVAVQETERKFKKTAPTASRYALRRRASRSGAGVSRYRVEGTVVAFNGTRARIVRGGRLFCRLRNRPGRTLERVEQKRARIMRQLKMKLELGRLSIECQTHERPLSHQFDHEAVHSFTKRDISLKQWSLDKSSFWRTAFSGVFLLAQAKFSDRNPTSGGRAYVGPFVRLMNGYASIPTTRGRRTILVRTWDGLSRDQKIRHWQSALLTALRDCPSVAYALLWDLLENERIDIPGHAIHDSLHHIVYLRLRTEIRDRDVVEDLLKKLVTAVETWNHKAPHGGLLSQSVLWKMSIVCDREQLLRLLDCLRSYDFSMADYTCLQMIQQLTKLGEFERALGLLATLERGTDAAMNVLVQAACITLLRTPYPTIEIHDLRAHILQQIYDLGIQPNRLLVDVIMVNAMEAGKIEHGWDLFRVSDEGGMAAAESTYCVLLSAGLRDDEDVATIWRIIERARSEGVLRTGLGHTALHAIRKLENKNKYRTDFRPFSALMPLYEDLYHLGPLKDLQILGQERQEVKDPSELMDPDPRALDTMIQAWCEQEKRPWKLEAVYAQYLYHVMNAHPVISRVAESSHVSTAFVIAFGLHLETLRLATEVVQNMLDPPVMHTFQGDVKDELAMQSRTPTSTSAPTLELPDLPNHQKSAQISQSLPGATAQNFPPPVSRIACPSSTTWNALLHAMFRARQKDAAEKVLAVMQAKGIKRDHVTWNTLLNGYARLQRSDMVIQTIHRMEADSFKPDEWAHRALSRVVDRQGLLDALSRAISERKALDRMDGDDGGEDTEDVGKFGVDEAGNDDVGEQYASTWTGEIEES